MIISKLSSGLGAMMAGGNPSEERGRSVDDFYPTPANVTQALLNNISIMFDDKIWEPCAGNGAMVDVILAHDKDISVYASDISPQRSDIVCSSFFDYTETPFGHDFIITNPPFNLAADIIEHAFSIGVTRMALMLKSTFFHAKGRKPLFDKYKPSFVMPLLWRPDFMGLGRPTMEVSWIVWERNRLGFPTYYPLSKP